MDELIDILSKKGVSNDKATEIANRLNGTDIIDLIFDLKSNTDESISSANDILSRFGVKLSESFNQLIKTNLKLDIFLKENNIKYISKGNLYLFNSRYNNKVSNFIKEDKMNNTNKRLMELAGISFDNNQNSQEDDFQVTPDSDDDVITDIYSDEVDVPTEVPVISDDNDIVPVEQSSELSQIQDFYNNIQTLVSNVKVSELKLVENGAKDLYDFIVNLKRSYLD